MEVDPADAYCEINPKRGKVDEKKHREFSPFFPAIREVYGLSNAEMRLAPATETHRQSGSSGRWTSLRRA